MYPSGGGSAGSTSSSMSTVKATNVVMTPTNNSSMSSQAAVTNDAAIAAAQAAAAALSGSRSNRKDKDVHKRQKEKFLMFARVLMKYLEQKDPAMHLQAKAIIKDCSERNKRREKGYESVTTSMRLRLHQVVGEAYWKRAESYLAHFLKEKAKETVDKRQKLQQQRRVKKSNQARKLQQRQLPNATAPPPPASAGASAVAAQGPPQPTTQTISGLVHAVEAKRQTLQTGPTMPPPSSSTNNSSMPPPNTLQHPTATSTSKLPMMPAPTNTSTTTTHPTQQQQQQQQQAALAVAQTASTALSGASSDSNAKDVLKRQKEQFLMFARVLMKYLEQKDPAMHLQAKAITKDCAERNKRQERGYESVTASMRRRLRQVVGEAYWKRAESYLAHFMKEKAKETVDKRQKLQQQRRVIKSNQARKLQQQQLPHATAPPPPPTSAGASAVAAQGPPQPTAQTILGLLHAVEGKRQTLQAGSTMPPPSSYSSTPPPNASQHPTTTSTSKLPIMPALTNTSTTMTQQQQQQAALAAAQAAATALSGSSSNSNDKDVLKRQKEQFLMFARVLMIYLEHKDPAMHLQAKAITKDCAERNKRQEKGYESVTTSMRQRLHQVVGEAYWKRAESYLAHFLKQKAKETVDKR
jgi:hypothetical protein